MANSFSHDQQLKSLAEKKTKREKILGRGDTVHIPKISSLGLVTIPPTSLKSGDFVSINWTTIDETIGYGSSNGWKIVGNYIYGVNTFILDPFEQKVDKIFNELKEVPAGKVEGTELKRFLRGIKNMQKIS